LRGRCGCDGTHAAGGVAAAESLSATPGGGDVNAGDPGARTSAVDDGLCPSSEGFGNSASPSSYLPTVYNDDDDDTPLLSLQNAAPGGSGNGEDCDGLDRDVTYAHLYDDAQSDDDDDDSADVLEAILGRVGQREDASYDDNVVDVSVGVNVGAVVGVGVNGQSVSLSVGLSVGLVVGSPPLTSLDSQGAHLRSESLMT